MCPFRRSLKTHYSLQRLSFTVVCSLDMFRLVYIYIASLSPFWLAIYRLTRISSFFFSFRLSGFFASLLSYVSWLANPIPPRRTPHLVLPVLMLSPTISTVRFSPYGLMKWTGGVCGERLGWCIWLGPLFPSYSWCKLGTGLRMR